MHPPSRCEWSYRGAARGRSRSSPQRSGALKWPSWIVGARPPSDAAVRFETSEVSHVDTSVVGSSQRACTGVPRPETSADDGTSDASDSRSHSRRRDESNESTETTDGAEATWTDETDDAEATTNCDDATERDDDEQLRARRRRAQPAVLRALALVVAAERRRRHDRHLADEDATAPIA